jgi:hypothetical protein
MGFQRLLQEIAYKTGALRSATAEYSPFQALIAVHLDFEKGRYTVGVAPDYDTVTLRRRRKAPSRRPQRPLKPLSRARGMRVQWVWLLINQQGYEDGLQFEFGADGSKHPVFVQFVAECSSLKVLTLAAPGRGS